MKNLKELSQSRILCNWLHAQLVWSKPNHLFPFAKCECVCLAQVAYPPSHRQYFSKCFTFGIAWHLTVCIRPRKSHKYSRSQTTNVGSRCTRVSIEHRFSPWRLVYTVINTRNLSCLWCQRSRYLDGNFNSNLQHICNWTYLLLSKTLTLMVHKLWKCY